MTPLDWLSKMPYSHRAAWTSAFPMISIVSTSRVLAPLVAVTLVVVALAAVSPGGAERDVVVRRGRGASHRLDSADGAAHVHDIGDVEMAPGAEVWRAGVLDGSGASAPQPALASAPVRHRPLELIADPIARVPVLAVQGSRPAPASGRAPPTL